MTDLSKYTMAGPVLLCGSCQEAGTGGIVKNFGQRLVPLGELGNEVARHEEQSHPATATRSSAEANCDVAMKASRALAVRADRVQRKINADDAYYRCYDKRTAYRDGMANGMGGADGDLAGLLGPDPVKSLAKALACVSEMGPNYPELTQGHDRASCDDFTCDLVGHLIDLASAVSDQLPAED